MEETTEGLCKKLLDEGANHAKSGEKAAAIACLDEVIARCAPGSEPWMPVSTAAAMFNKATCYRFASDTDEAVPVFDEIVSRFASRDELPFRRYVCMALYNKGIALQDARRWLDAVDAFGVTTSHCKDDTDSAIKVRVALSLGGAVACLIELQRFEEVVAVLTELIEKFESSPEPAIQQVIGKYILLFPQLLTKLRPAAHAANLPSNIRVLEELRGYRDDPNSAEGAASAEESYRRYIARDVEAAAKSHVDAITVLENHWSHRKPFALFLRSFDVEASEVKMTPTKGYYRPVRSVNFGYSKVEEAVCGILGERVPDLALRTRTP